MSTQRICLLIALLGMFLASCDKKIDNMCVVKGSVDNPSLNGSTVYMIDYQHKNRYAHEAIDSALIENGRFLFQDSVKNPVCRYLYVSNNDIRLGSDMFVEEGVVKINLSNGAVSGTKLNDRLNEYLVALDEYEVNNKIKELIQEYNATDNQSVMDSIDAVYDAVKSEYDARLSFNADKM